MHKGRIVALNHPLPNRMAELRERERDFSSFAQGRNPNVLGKEGKDLPLHLHQPTAFLVACGY